MSNRKKIATLSQLYEAALERRSVVVPGLASWEDPRAAAFLLSIQGRVLHRLFEHGMFVYKPKARKTFNEAVKKAGTT